MAGQRIIEGDRVIIALNTSKSHNSKREKYVGRTGKVDTAYQSGVYKYGVCFDDAELRESNVEEGHWLWCDDEVIKLEDQNYIR